MSIETSKLVKQLQGIIRKNINQVGHSELMSLWRNKPNQMEVDDYLHGCEMSHHLWERVSDRVEGTIAKSTEADKDKLAQDAWSYHVERFVERYREPPCDLVLTRKVTAAGAKVLKELLELEGNVVQVYKQLNEAQGQPVGEGLFPERYKPLVKKLAAAEIPHALVPVKGK